MNDLQFLQLHLYSALITYQECTEIFLSSLLGSRNLENIRLAPTWLRDIYNCDKESAVKLAVKAAQDYFNAAANYLDPDMDFAKACLDLVKTLIAESRPVNLNELAKTDPVISRCIQLIDTERDLIMAMKLIAEFEHNILPVKVRLSTDRLQIIKDILKSNHNAYKSYEQLLNLASLLRICSSEAKSGELAVEPHVILLVAEHSLDMPNLNVVSNMCAKLVKLNYSPGWQCVYKLGYLLAARLAHEFKIIEEKPAASISSIKHNNPLFGLIKSFDFAGQASFRANKSKLLFKLNEIEELLAFAVTHCAELFIEEILMQKLCIENVRIRINSIDSDNQTRLEHESPVIELAKFSTDYFDSHKLIEFDMNETKANNEKLKYCLMKLVEFKGQSNKINVQELIDCVNFLVRLDLNLALGFLMDLNDLNVFIEEALFKLDSNLSYEFVLYLFSLNVLCDSLRQTNRPIKSCVYNLKASILKTLMQLVEYEEASYQTKIYNDLFKAVKHNDSFKLYKQVNKAYTAYKQNKALKELDNGIDLTRFENDQVYKKDTILGLSMDTGTFELACSLARFYSFDSWEVYMTFAEYLFNDKEGISLEEIEAHLSPLMSVLKSKSDEFIMTMERNILSRIEGQNLDKLLLFYSLLDTEEAGVHVRTLKKLKSVSLSGFDYKLFLANPLDVIGNYLNESNVPFFAKLLPKLPTGLAINSSRIHVIFCLKNFWLLLGEQMEWTNEAMNMFADKFEDLNESLKKLDPDTDLDYFVHETLMSEKSCQRLNVQVRKNVLKKVNKLLKQQPEQKKSERLGKSLQLVQSHLKMAENIQKIFEANNNNKLVHLSKVYANRLDLNLANYAVSRGEPAESDKLHLLEETLVYALFEGFSIELVTQMVNTFEIKELNMKHLIKVGLNKLCDLLMQKHKSLQEAEVNKLKHLASLNVLLESIAAHLNAVELDRQEKSKSAKQPNSKKKKNLQEVLPADTTDFESNRITHADVMDCMRLFCNNQQVDINLRLLVLEELKKTFKHMQEEDLMLLLVYKTNALLVSCGRFGDQVELVESSSIRSESQRAELFDKCVQASVRQEDFSALISLLKIWPEFQASEDIEKKPWNQLLVKLIINKIAFVECIKELHKADQFNEVDIEFVREQLESDETWNKSDGLFQLAYLKVCLACRNDKLVKKFLRNTQLECFHLATYENLADHEDVASLDSILNDTDLMSLLMEENFYFQLVNTPLYLIFAHYVLNHESKLVIYEMVRFLKQNEHTIEAARLLVETENFYTSYRTLSSSLALITKFS